MTQWSNVYTIVGAHTADFHFPKDINKDEGTCAEKGSEEFCF